MVCIKKNRGKEIERKTSLVYNLPSARFATREKFFFILFLYAWPCTGSIKQKQTNFESTAAVIMIILCIWLFFIRYICIYIGRVVTHTKKCWNTRWVNELVPWKTQCCYFYRNNNAGATMLISCGTKKTRSIYMANTVSKNETKKENH